MENEEEHTGRQMEANTQSGSLKHYLHLRMLQSSGSIPDACSTCCAVSAFGTAVFVTNRTDSSVSSVVNSSSAESTGMRERASAMLVVPGV